MRELRKGVKTSSLSPGGLMKTITVYRASSQNWSISKSMSSLRLPPRPVTVAKAATTTTPIVFVAVGDPVKVGLVLSLAQPGGNVTGLSLLTPELKREAFGVAHYLLGHLQLHRRDYEPEERRECGFPARDEVGRRSIGHLHRGLGGEHAA